MSLPSRPFHRTTAARVVGVACLLAIATVVVIGIVGGCRRESDAPKTVKGPPWFEDVTDKLRLTFTHDAGPADGSHFMPQICGSGCALFDFDGDGRLDILLVHNAGPKSSSKNQLFQQQPDGTFKDVSKGSGLDVAGYFMGAYAADVNNDGLIDVYVTAYGGGGRLFLNKGKGRFEEAKDCGLANPLWGTAASFFDYDRDGWLDLVVVNYVELGGAIMGCAGPNGLREFCAPSNYKGTVTRLYRNLGVDANGKWKGFEDRTEKAGFVHKAGPGLGVLCADLNGDGWPDIFVTNDGAPNHLWVNQHDGTFKEDSARMGVAFNYRGETAANMGVAYGDYDGDGLNDILVTHLTTEYPSLFKQGPRGMYADVAHQSGLTQSKWRGTGWGTVLADFNHDTALDVVMVNGRVVRTSTDVTSFWPAYYDRNQVFINDGKGQFRDASLDNPDLCDRPNNARGLAVGDIDGDGTLDLLVTDIAGRARIFRNVAPNRGHWLMIRAVDPQLKRDAIGAEVRIKVAGRSLERLVQPSMSYLSNHDVRVHFGLGASDSVEEIVVHWPGPGDVTERFRCPGVDRILLVERGKGEKAP